MADAVLDVIEQLAVAHALDVGAAQIRWTRILTAADFGLTAAVIGVTQFALARYTSCPAETSALPAAVLSGFFIALKLAGTV